MEKNIKKRGVNINDIYTGRVVFIKEYDNEAQIPDNNIVIGSNKSGRIACLDVRKIVFTMQENLGVDLSRTLLKRNKYSYQVIDSTLNNGENLSVKNNTLVIDNPEKVGTILTIAGFPSVVRGDDISEITKMLLSKEKVLKIREHVIGLSEGDIFDLEQIKDINSQFNSLYLFKTEELPTKVQKIEKVYKKHFA